MNPQHCEICGEHKPNSLETHHVVPQRHGGSDEPENLVRLCSSCHAAVEKIWDDSFYSRLKIGKRATEYEQSKTAEGTEISERKSYDKQIPERSPHVKFSFWHPLEDESVEKLMIQDSENPEWSELEELYELPKDDPAKPDYFYDRNDPKVIHCCYCNQFFEPWEHAVAARHLRIKHAIENPYEQEKVEAEFLWDDFAEEELTNND